MADYHAVLQRTLAGFSDPKPELRKKLFERARTTISRQLENRTPAITGPALTAELDKLELAIYEIERGYDPSYPAPTLKAAPPAPPAPPPLPVAEAPVAPTPPPPAAVPEQTSAPTFADTLAGIPSSGTVESVPPGTEYDSMASPAPAGFEPLTPLNATLPPAGEAVSPTVQNPDVNDAAVDRWAEEFLSQPPAPEQVVYEQAQPVVEQQFSDPALQAAPPTSPALPLPAELQQPGMPSASAEHSWHPEPLPDPLPQPIQSADGSYGEAASGPIEQPFGAADDETLVIPPAAGFGNGATKRPRKSKMVKWLVIVLLLALLGAAAAYGWVNRELVLDKIGMSDLLDDPVRPKPVKTISITPQPASSEQPLAPEKAESRLNSDGEEITVPSGSENSSGLQPVIEPPVINVPVAEQPANGTLPVSQNAILYEEGASAAQNSVDAGRVVWSVVEEETTSGTAKEPAIRARIEIPGRNVVLIMKIKRNADKALPASHLIELVFAVPDDFSGGAIGQVSRFVLKQSEQGRGEGLVGVPARIADGIFLIALNNLEQARNKNESLLKTRDWIDIPLQYRTGRRALMTIEKGVPGSKVFEQVFEAWSKL